MALCTLVRRWACRHKRSNMKSLNAWLWGGILGVLLCSQFVSAIQVIPLSIEDLSHRSDLIVRASVIAKECRLDEKSRIITEVELRVSESWKGPISSGPLKIIYGGGILGDRRVRVSGQVDFQIGEEIIGFLVRGPQGQLTVIGVHQGKFQVFKSPSDGTELARSPYHGGDDAGASPLVAKNALTPSLSNRLTLSELKQRVLAAKSSTGTGGAQ